MNSIGEGALAFLIIYTVELGLIQAFYEGKRVYNKLETCERCGQKMLTPDYHYRHCRGKPKSILVRARAFKKGERQW